MTDAAPRPRPTTAELWAWQHEQTDPEPIDVSGEEVVAVLVVHNGAAWLEQTLDSLRRLDRRPTHLLGVDAGSFDRSAEIMRHSGLFSDVVQTAADGFGAAVAEALHRHDPSVDAPHRGPGGRWYWFLHDDCIVEPDTLTRLLTQGVEEPDTAMLGPKLRQYGRDAGPPRLAGVGESIAGTGRIDRHIDEGEIDQHQHRPQDTLGLSSCGLLVRREVFQQLGGFAPEIPVFTDGLELGWRATEQGYRVRTCPQAVITHREAGRSGRRSSPMIAERPGRSMRLMAMRTVAGHRHGGMAWLGSLWLVLCAFARAVGYLFGKAPGRAGDEIRAAVAFLGTGASVRSLRSYSGAGDADTRERITRLRPGPFAGLMLAHDAVVGELARRWREIFGADASSSLDELTGDDYSGTEHQRRNVVSPMGLALVLGVITAVFAGRGLIGAGRLQGPRLLPSQENLAAAFDAFWTPIVGAADSLAPPWLGWVALGSAITAGRPEWFVTIVLLGGVPLAFITAQVWLRRVSTNPWIRTVAGGLYALTPVLLGAVNRGALGVGIVAILLPLVAAALYSLAVNPTRGADSWRPAWAAGLILTLFCSFLPMFLVFAIVVVLTAGFVLGHGRFARGAVAVGVPVVLLGPWLLSALIGGTARILLGPDAALGGQQIAAWWEYLIGRTPGPGLPALWMSATFLGVLWLAALLALLVAGTRPLAWVGWATAGLAGMIAIAASRMVVGTLPAGAQVRPDVAPWVLVMTAGLITAAAVGADQLARLSGRARWGTRAGGTVLSLLAVGALVWWALAGAVGPIERGPANRIPAFVVNAQTGPAGARTLAIDLTGDQPAYQLVQGHGPRLGDADRGLATGGSAEWPGLTRTVVAQMISGAADESVGETLEQLAVTHVWVRGADDTERIRIGNTPGLGSVSGDDDWLVWTVPGTGGRWMLVDAEGQATPVPLDGRMRGAIDVPEGNHRLVLAEPGDARWRVELNGQSVYGAPAGRGVAFDLATAGHLEIELAPMVPRWIFWVLAGLGILVAILSLPSIAGVRERRRAAQEADFAPARAVGRSAPASPPTETRADPDITRPAAGAPPGPGTPADDPDITRPAPPRVPGAPVRRGPEPEPDDPDITRPAPARAARRAADDDGDWDTMVLPAARARRALPTTDSPQTPETDADTTGEARR